MIIRATTGWVNPICNAVQTNKVRLLSDMIEGQPAEIEFNGKILKRVVRYNSSVGTYVVINNKMYFAYELSDGEIHEI